MTESTSYAITWTEHRARFVGHAQLCPCGLRLAGRGDDGREALRLVSYTSIRGAPVRRLDGHRRIELDLNGGPIAIRSLDRPGSLAELAERLHDRVSTRKEER